MLSLYPDTSYCTSDIGRLLFRQKPECDITGTVTKTVEAKGIAGTTHIEYHILFTCSSTDHLQEESRKFLLISRFRDLSKLHGNLAKLHKQLYLRGIFPTFAPSRLLKSQDASVIEERKCAINNLFLFVLDSEVLRKSRALQEFVEKSEEKSRCSDDLPPDLFSQQPGQSAMGSQNTINSETSSMFEQDTSETRNLHITRSTSDFQFPRVDTEVPCVLQGSGQRKTSMKTIFPKIALNNESGDNYLVRAGKLVATAQRAELEHAYELAFQCYKNAASSLIQGIRMESDAAKRSLVRKKTAKYLFKAEKLFRTYLSYDGSAFNIDALLASTMHLRDPNLLAFQCSPQSLKNYRVVGVLPSFESPRRVLLVEDKTNGKHAVLKLLEKGSGNRVQLPSGAPHMVPMHIFFELENCIVVLVDYIERGRLWNFLSRYLAEGEQKWLNYLRADGENEVPNEVFNEPTETSDTTGPQGYRGRRVLFSVSADFCHIAAMVDENQSTDVPGCRGEVCSMGEDVVADETNQLPSGEVHRDNKIPRNRISTFGDFYMIPGASRGEVLSSSATSVHEEAPAPLTLHRPEDHWEAGFRGLAGSLGYLRHLLKHQRKPFSFQFLTENLVAHWDLHPDKILINDDGNLVISFYGHWLNENRRRTLISPYAAPESSELCWSPSERSDVWTVGVLLFELLSGVPLAIAAPHGVLVCPEVPVPEYLSISITAKHLLNRVLCAENDRLTLEEVRAHPFFGQIQWQLYDNPHSFVQQDEASVGSPREEIQPLSVDNLLPMEQLLEQSTLSAEFTSRENIVA